MEKRTWVAIAVACVVVVIVVGAIVMGRWPGRGPSGASQEDGQITVTREAVPSGVMVPDAGAAAPQGVAVPNLQGQASPSGNAQYRSFSIIAAANAYTPSTIIVNAGDVVDLEIAATDANYGFTQPDYGFNVAIPHGKTQRIQFSANMTGKFTFYCASCGGPSKGPVGYIIVK